MARLQTKIGTLRRRVLALETDYYNLKQRFRELQAEHEALQKKDRDSRQRIAELDACLPGRDTVVVVDGELFTPEIKITYEKDGKIVRMFESPLKPDERVSEHRFPSEVRRFKQQVAEERRKARERKAAEDAAWVQAGALIQKCLPYATVISVEK